MQWTTQANASFPQHPRHTLTVAANEPYGPALIEYWRRILTDAAPLHVAARWTMKIELCPKSFAKDSPGQAEVTFRSSVNRQSDAIGTFVLRCDRYTCEQRDGEDDDAYGARQVQWLLPEYELFKTALQDARIAPLFQLLCDHDAFRVDAATANGFFDLQPGKAGFGPLPEDDQRLLAGEKPEGDDPLVELTRGVIDFSDPASRRGFGPPRIQ